jgi:tetratricopeptide (TPR) repeat protein
VTSSLSPVDLAQRGDAALRLGHNAEARALYQAALANDPALPDTWYNFGWVLRANREFEAALIAYDNALRHGIKNPEEVRLNRAAILADHLFQYEPAEDELRQALTISPNFLPALLNLGTLFEDLGHADAARDAYLRTTALAPGNGRAHARLAMIDLAQGHISKALASLEAALAHPGTSSDRAEMLYAMATALDSDEQFDAAFRTVETANRLAQTLTSNRYNPKSHEQLVTRIINTFTRPRVTSFSPPSPQVRPLFLVGMFRSGSTLVEQILARHSAITGGGEIEFIPALVQKEFSPYPETASQLDAPSIAAHRSSYLVELGRIASEGFVTDKRCDNFLNIGLIKAIFPDAYIINTIRHPLDMILSNLFLYFGEAVDYSFSQHDAAHYYIQYCRLGDHWREIYGHHIHEISYDRVVGDPQREIEPALDLLNLGWEDACLSTQLSARSIRTASTWQVRKPLHTNSSGRWRHYGRLLDPARAMLTEAGLL